MVRKTVKSNSSLVFIPIPANFIGKELEVIVFEKNEEIETYKNSNKKKVSYDALSIDTINFKFNRDEANQR